MSQLNIPNRPERATFRMPADQFALVALLLSTQEGYEQAKANVSTLEEQKMDRAEARRFIESAFKEAVALNSYPSQAARDRAEKDVIAKDDRLKAIEDEEGALRLALVRHTEDVSVFRHRMLTLRSALDSLGREGGR